MRVGAPPGGHVQQRGFRVPSAPRPARSSGFFSGIGRSIGHIGVAAHHASHSASIPHRAPQAGTDVQSGHGYLRAAPRAVSHSRGVAQAAPQQSGPSRLARVLAATHNGGGSNPWNGGQRGAATGQILSTWFALRAAGLLPATAVPPKIKFDTKELPGAYAYVTGSPGNMNTLHVPPTFAKALTGRVPQFDHQYAREAIVHELAHTAQNKGANQTKGMAEGGAQAFAQIAAPQVFSKQPSIRNGYWPYVRAMAMREPNDWINRNQFKPGGQAPMINMPGTRSFGVATRKLGVDAGQGAASVGAKGAYSFRRIAPQRGVR